MVTLKMNVILLDEIDKVQTQLNNLQSTFNSHTHKYAGSSSVGGAATSAIKLATARTFITNLASTASGSFNGEGNCTSGVTGVLPIANGGTGASDIRAMLSNLKIESYFNQLTDCDKPPAIICWLNGWSESVLNKPFTSAVGILLTAWQHSESTGNLAYSHITQLAINCDNGYMYVRRWDDDLSAMSAWRRC